MKKLLPFIMLFCLFSLGCSYKSGHTDYTITPLKTSSAPYDSSQGIYTMMPADFTKGTTVEMHSGAATQQALITALGKFSGKKASALAPQSLQEAMESAKQQDSQYLVKIDIIDWDDPPASFQISSDRGEVLVSIYDVTTGKIIRSDNMRCNGSAQTINLIGSYSPKDCLAPALVKWAETIF